jgi:Ca2+-binding RTX toxin-like protein
LGLASGFAITDVIDSIPREGSSLRGTAQWINDYSYGVTFSLYRDLNGNGILDTSDGLIGVRTPTSNVNGAMLFQLNVDAGSYLIKVTDSNGFGNPFNLNMYSRSAARVVYDAGSTYALSRADRLTGSAANNVYIVDNASDLIAETLNGGIDTVRSSVSYILPANVENLTLSGSAAINGTGNALANTITGNGAANILNGAAGADRLIGGGGNDRLIGGLGNDTLSGGLGADIFRFDAALSSTTNRNTITDFNAAQGDRIQLENAVFTALTRTGTLAATAFRSGTSFTAAAQRILYNPATGNLSYDSNGSAAGGINALIATLSTRRALTSSMLVVT